jgi:peptide-methionine (S)-S-oxide reductase
MSAIFYHSEEQREKALASRDQFQASQSRKIVTKVDEAQTFYNAEDYHQKYILRQNPSILAELNLSDAELITSHVAARLNGYLGGHGTQEQLQEELDDFVLSNKAKEKIRAKVGAKQSGL